MVKNNITRFKNKKTIKTEQELQDQIWNQYDLKDDEEPEDPEIKIKSK